MVSEMVAGADDHALVRAINDVGRVNLKVTGRAADGTSGGAILVDFEDGMPGVVTTFLGTRQRAEQTVEVVNYAKSTGLPVPLHRHIAEIDRGIYLVQERLAGSPLTTVTPAAIDAVVAMNDRFADLLVGHQDVPVLPLCLHRSGEPYPQHEVLARYSARSRAVLDAIKAVGATDPRGAADGDDLHHVDLDLSNVLFDETGSVVGVVDWNLGAFRGDRHQALVKTRFEQEWALRGPTPLPEHVAAASHLDDVLRRRVAPGDLRRYWASRLLYQLHWILQYGQTDHVEWHLDVAEERLL